MQSPDTAKANAKAHVERPEERSGFASVVDGWPELADASWEVGPSKGEETASKVRAERPISGLQARYGNEEVARVSMSTDPAELEAEHIAHHGLPQAGIRSHASGASAPLPPEVELALRGVGHALEDTTRTRMEWQLADDFGDVRVHDDETADHATRVVGARAFTVGADVVFAKGEYRPGSADGDRLLKHELVHVKQQRHAPTAIQTGPPDPKKTPPVVDVNAKDSELTTDMLLELLVKQLELAGPFGGKEILLSEVRKDRDHVASTSAEEASVRKHVVHLLRTLKMVKLVIANLDELAKRELYLADIADGIVKKLETIRNLYATALLFAYSDLDDSDERLTIAEKAMTAFPDFLMDQYLSPQGIPKVIAQIPPLAAEVGELRTKAAGPGVRHPVLEKMLHLTGKDLWPKLETDPSGMPIIPKDYRKMPGEGVAWKWQLDDLIQAARSYRGINPKEAQENTQKVLRYAQYGVSGLTALALEEQFSYFQTFLDDSWIDWLHDSKRGVAKKYKEKFGKVIEKFETVESQKTADDMWKIVREAQGDLAGIVNSDEFQQGMKAITDRLETIQTVRLIGKVALIIAASAFTAGEAGVMAGGLLRVAGASELLIGAGEFVTEALVFTAVQRKGEEFAFGKVEGSFGGDFLTNLAMFGALKGVGKVYGTVFKLSPEAGKFAKIAFGAGKVGTAMVTLHAFSELQHIITDPEHKPMSGEERYRAILQNIILMAALEAGRFIAEPIERRITDPIRERLKVAYEKRFESLQGEREALSGKLKALETARTTAKPEEIQDVLDQIQKIWNEELRLIADAAKKFKGTGKGKISDSDLEATMMKYEAARAALELRLARLGIEASLAPKTGKPAFMQVAPGVVAYDPAQRPTLDAFYKEKGGTLEPSKEFPDLLEGRIGHEVTYYMPEGDLPSSLADASKLAGTRDRAIREGETDPKAKTGLARLTTDLKLSPRSADTILSTVAPENLAAFLRAVADPAINSSFGKRKLESLAKSRKAMDFIFKWGGDAFKSIQGLKGWGDGLGKALDQANSKLEGAKPADQTKLLGDIAAAKAAADLDTALGKAPKPKTAPPPRPTKKNMGVNRATKSWDAFRSSEDQYAKDHSETLTVEQLDLRADLQQVLDRAKSHAFDKLVHDSRLSILDRFEELGGKAGIDRGRLNALRGSLAEALFAPEYGKPKKGFADGGKEVAVNAPGAHVPDYDLPAPAGKTEWVNLKSDLIDQGTKQKKTGAYQSGVDAARRYLDDSKTAAKKVPAGDFVSLDFIRDPGAATRAAMLDILFGPDSPVHRVKFGDGSWLDRKAVGK